MALAVFLPSSLRAAAKAQAHAYESCHARALSVGARYEIVAARGDVTDRESGGRAPTALGRLAAKPAGARSVYLPAWPWLISQRNREVIAHWHDEKRTALATRASTLGDGDA